MPEQKKMTFAQKAILNRIAQKEAMNQKQSGFQDCKEYYTDYHDGYSVYGDSNAVSGGACEDHTDYTEAWSMTLDAKGTPVDHDYNETHGDYCDFAPAPAELPKPKFFQRLFGKHK